MTETPITAPFFYLWQTRGYHKTQTCSMHLKTPFLIAYVHIIILAHLELSHCSEGDHGPKYENNQCIKRVTVSRPNFMVVHITVYTYVIIIPMAYKLLLRKCIGTKVIFYNNYTDTVFDGNKLTGISKFLLKQLFSS